MRVNYVDLAAQWEEDKDELLPIIESVLASGQYILGDQVELLEAELAEFCGTEFCVALNSGTDALVLALSALGVGPGDEVVTPPNSFVASTAAIAHLGATPVFADVQENQSLDPASVLRVLTSKTKAIMPVHLTGRLCKMEEFESLSRESGVPIVEDAAQSVGSTYNDRSSGSWGVAGCFSGHPLKNLAAVGDAGYLVTSDSDMAAHARRLRNHGLIDRNTVKSFGVVSRMDTLKAAVLRYRLGKLPHIIQRRRNNADLYFEELKGLDLTLPVEGEKEFNTFHTFVIQVDKRDELREHLAVRGVGTAIHYPIPIHLQPAAARYGYGPGSFPNCEAQASRILSLPIHQNLDSDQIHYVATCVKEFYG